MDDLESRLEQVVEELQFAGDWNDRYRLLVDWGDEAVPLAENDRRTEDEVPGCSSPLWLRVERADALSVKAASTGVLPRALAALLCRLFDGLAALPDPFPPVAERLDLRRHLSPTRMHTFERMLDRIKERGR
jgi:cysteine desulfuration protein SufE